MTNLVDELAKLQQLRADGALTEEEFSQAKRKLLASDTPEEPQDHAQTINLSLKEGLDEIVDEKSTLGGAANRYVDYQYVGSIIGGIVFIIALIVFAIIFSNFNTQMSARQSQQSQPSPYNNYYGR